MATGKGIEIAEDGVATVGMTEARAQLTSLIREVRYGGQVGAFTERGARQAYLVTPDFYEKALEDRRMVLATMDYIEAKLSAQPDSKVIAELAEFASHLSAQRSD
ncbi:type II toxin-antitoxin system Phd/YefM family antitoxin [Streptomyces sp. NBC_01383]|uniref:hypothetical protein n=1 Tax=Streptomyces sp. NBC_01383 TaxID=2903846 RepID=UPI0032477507